MGVKRLLSITILASSLAAVVCTGLDETENDTNVTETEVVITPTSAPTTMSPTVAPTMSPTVAPTMPTTTFTVAIKMKSVAGLPTDAELKDAASADEGASVEVVVTIEIRHDFTFPANTNVDEAFARTAVAAMFAFPVSQVTITMSDRRLSVDGRDLQSTPGTGFSAVVATTDRQKAASVGETSTSSVADDFVAKYKESASVELPSPSVADPVFEAAIEYVVVSADADVQVDAPTAEQFKQTLVAANSDYAELEAEVKTPAPTQAPTPYPTLAAGDTHAPTPSPPATTEAQTTTSMATTTETPVASTTAPSSTTAMATGTSTTASTTATNMMNQTTSAGSTEESLASLPQAWSAVVLAFAALRM